jgi:cytohesin
VFQAALKAGVSVNQINNYGQTPLVLAIDLNLTWFVKALFQAGAPVNKSATYDAHSTTSDDLLARAARIGNLEIVDILLEAGVNLDNVANVYDQGTALHLAVENERHDLVLVLLAVGAKTEVRDRYKRTQLHLAVKIGNIELVRILLTAGANPGAKDENDETPLDLAESYHRADIIEALRQAK